MVSSIWAYSAGAPVLQVWNRWFRPGSSLTVTRLLPAGLERRLDLGEVLPGRDLAVLLADERQDRAVDLAPGSAADRRSGSSGTRAIWTILSWAAMSASTLAERLALVFGERVHHRLDRRRASSSRSVFSSFSVLRISKSLFCRSSCFFRAFSSAPIAFRMRLALQVEDLLAGQSGAGQEDDEGDVRRPRGDHRRDDPALAVAHQADAPAVDLAPRLEEGDSGQDVAGEVVAGRLSTCSRSSRRRRGRRPGARRPRGGSACRPGPGTACARRSSRRGPARPSR